VAGGIEVMPFIEYEIIPKMDREVKYIIPNFTSTDATNRAFLRHRCVTPLSGLGVFSVLSAT
jgi:hypothetical protein